jgi:hypothetical protein
MEAMRLWNDQIQMPSDLLSLVNVTATWNGIGRGDFKEMEVFYNISKISDRIIMTHNTYCKQL